MAGRISTVLCVLMLTSACADNEQSFYVEHVKVQPEAPDCEVTVSDGIVPAGLLDLIFRNPYTGWYLVTNGLVAREDFGNLVTESNGIVIDGTEVYVRGTDGALLGNTEYYEFEHYVAPESSDVWLGIALPSSVVDALAEEYGCPRLTYDMDEISVSYGLIYSVTRFIGHTLGGTDVRTPDFTFPIEVCCGCLIAWGNCNEMDPCSRYCEEPNGHGMCTLGVANGGDPVDCRSLYHNPGATWTGAPGECTDETTGLDRPCTCDDCST
ncbi:MAG: hypothetical protein QNJ97_03215 [Myxococcota bacterium]|nr:hypothetical protein [Myxococcota bacterium]